MDFHRRSSGDLPSCFCCRDRPASFKRVSYKSFNKGLVHSKSMPETMDPQTTGGIISWSPARNIIPKAKDSIANFTNNAKNKIKGSSSFSKLKTFQQKVEF